MINIDTKEELSLYNLEGKWNDYIGAQKEVLRVLREEDFFTHYGCINTETGLCIRITSKGIRETIGNGNRFQTLPKKLKQYKIATIRYLPYLIQKGEMIADNVENSHDNNGYTYAYFRNSIKNDEEVVDVRISVKKKVDSNHFWIHNIDEYKKL